MRTKQCIKCGKTIPYSDKFCKYCGTCQTGTNLNFVIKPLSQMRFDDIKFENSNGKQKQIKQNKKHIQSKSKPKKHKSKQKASRRYAIIAMLCPIIAFIIVAMINSSLKVMSIGLIIGSIIGFVFITRSYGKHKIISLIAIIWLLLCIITSLFSL